MNFLCDYLDLLSIMADFKEAAIRAFAHAAGETVEYARGVANMLYREARGHRTANLIDILDVLADLIRTTEDPRFRALFTLGLAMNRLALAERSSDRQRMTGAGRRRRFR